jgi:putative endonuclease
MWCVYLLRCHDNSLYCGVTNNIGKRLIKHSRGTGAKYTRSRLPIKLVWNSTYIDKSTAYKAEYFIKQHSKKQKEELLLNIGSVLNKTLLKRFGIRSRQITI